MTSLDDRAAAIVAEMSNLGAIFRISDAGPTGDARWHWQPESETMRVPIRKFWTAVEDRNTPGFAAAMVRAIRAQEAGGTR